MSALVLTYIPIKEFFEYSHCSVCGVKIDYGNYVEIGDRFILCGDKEHCSYHNNCKELINQADAVILREE